jgi:V/A-type H+-transporting ATPase subunit A
LEYPEVVEYLDERVEKGWVEKVYKGKTLVQRGKEASEQINILGDDGVPVEYHERYYKSELLDFVILQQDAFDEIDANCPLERQKYVYNMVLDVCDKSFNFVDFEECATFFKGLINLFRQMNYTEWQSEKFHDYEKQIHEYVATKVKEN